MVLKHLIYYNYLEYFEHPLALKRHVMELGKCNMQLQLTPKGSPNLNGKPLCFSNVPAWCWSSILFVKSPAVSGLTSALRWNLIVCSTTCRAEFKHTPRKRPIFLNPQGWLPVRGATSSQQLFLHPCNSPLSPRWVKVMVQSSNDEPMNRWDMLGFTSPKPVSEKVQQYRPGSFASFTTVIEVWLTRHTRINQISN